MNDTTTNSKKRVLCPRSVEMGWEPHYGTAAQIEKYGLCTRCRAKAKEHSKAILSGKVEKPVDLKRNYDGFEEQDHIAFDGEHGAVKTTDFDYGAIDVALGYVEDTAPDARAEAAQLVSLIFQWCFRPGQSLRTCAARFSIIGSGLNPQLLDGLDFKGIGRCLKLTKASISKHGREFQERFAVKLACCRSDEAREAMRRARLRQIQAAGGKPGGRP